MSAPLVDFESENLIKAKRDEKRKVRAIILQKAKDDYEKRERKKELRKQRGEDTWMLPAVNSRLEAEEEKTKLKKHKNKKKKKIHKKEKKHKQKSKDEKHRSSSSDEDSEEMEWIEKASENTTASVKKYTVTLPPQAYLGDKPGIQEEEVPSLSVEKREDWMESPFMTATFSRDDIRKEKEADNDKEPKISILDNPGQSAMELNPFWKDGGTGLPEEASSKKKRLTVKSGIADGGAGWLRKSYQRAMEIAQEQGRSIESVAAERWGSLEKYYELLAAAEGVSDRSRTSWKKDGDRHYERNRQRQGDRSYGRDVPRDWNNRRDGDKADEERDRVQDNDRENYRYTDGDRYRGIRRDQESRGSDKERDKYQDREQRWDDKRSYNDKDRYRNRESKESPSSRTFMKPFDTDRDSNKYREMNESPSSRTFKKPFDTDDKSSSCSVGDMKGKFKKPGVESVSKERPSASLSRGSSSLDSVSSWKKAFKKPGELSDSKHACAKSIQSSSSSSSSGWKKSNNNDDLARSSKTFSPSTPTWKKSDSRNSNTIEDGHSHSRKIQSSSSEYSSGSSSSSSSEEDEEDSRKDKCPPPPPPAIILTETEMNQLGAKLIKAELMGNEALTQKLKSKLEAARRAKTSQPTKPMAQQGRDKPDRHRRGNMERQEEAASLDDEVLLTRTDRSGQSWPLPESTVPAELNKGRRKKKQKIATHGEAGQRERYFADDDELDLKTLVQREKMSSAEDQEKLFSRMAAKSMEKLDSEYSLDDMFVSSAAKKESTAQTEERERASAIAEHRRLAATLSKCPRCIDSPDMQKHLIIALGIKVYLSLPATKSLTDGHCLIIPMQHSIASTGLDEDVWSEIQVFRKGLTKMFVEQGNDVIFLETCMNPKKQRHMCIECIPVPKEIGDLAPLYFKKAIQESESEWMENKKLIDTRNKGIRKSVPTGFPYFSVDFGLDGGFAHIIEDQELFPHYFGKEIIGGALDVEPQLWRRPHRQNFDDQRKKVLQFADWWKPFDWTQRIER